MPKMQIVDGPAGQISPFYLMPWPVCIIEDFPFSLYIVATSESDEGLVYLILDIAETFKIYS